jgi:hypothetical protein
MSCVTLSCLESNLLGTGRIKQLISFDQNHRCDYFPKKGKHKYAKIYVQRYRMQNSKKVFNKHMEHQEAIKMK